MKIVHLIGYFQPEFGYKEYYIARNQVKAGHEVHVVTSDRVFPFPNYKILAKSLGISESRNRGIGDTVIDGINVHRLPTLFEVKDSILIRNMEGKLREIKPEIVHAYSPVQITPLLASKLKEELGYFLILDEQQFETHHSFFGFLRFNLVVKNLAKDAFKKADVIFCPSEAQIDFVKKYYRVDERKVKLIPLGVDTDVYHFDEEERQKTRNSLKIKISETLLITTGRISKEKNLEVLLHAIKKLSEKSIKLLLVGEGDKEHLQHLISQTKKLRIEGRVLFHPFVPEKDLYKYYSAADIGVWPIRPTIGMVNAIGCELPILIPNHLTVKHLVEMENGLLFDPEKEKDLDEKITAMLKTKSNLVMLRRKAKKLVSETLSYKRLALKDIDIYEQYK